MQTVYVACLVGGAVATALFVLFGWVGGAHAGHVHIGHAHLHEAGHPHAGHAGFHSSHAPSRLAGALGWGLSWISPLTIAAAALWFGGIGLLTRGGVLGLLFM